jgi:hypothetical protein
VFTDGDEMTESTFMRRIPPRGRYGCAVALALTASVTAMPAAAAAPAPTPSSSAPALKLPVIPARLDRGSADCTKGSATVMKSVPWAQRQLGLSRAGMFSGGAGVTVGVVDTGVSAKAHGLSGRVTAAGDASTDCVGHGTFIAGIIAAAPGAGAGFSGVAPAAHIFAASGTDAAGTPGAALVAQGIRSAVDAGAGVVDVSEALPRGSKALTSAVEYAAKHDVLVVAPGVPDGTPVTSDDDAPPPMAFWPAAEEGVISVLDIDIKGQRPDGSLVPRRADLSAPGQGVTGIGPSGAGHYLGNGSSVATAFVAGAAALVRSYHPELSAEQVAGRLRATAYPAEVPALDINGALTGVLPSAGGTGVKAPRAADSSIHLTADGGDAGAVRRALLLAGGCVLLALGLWCGSALLRRSRAARPAGS